MDAASLGGGFGLRRYHSHVARQWSEPFHWFEKWQAAGRLGPDAGLPQDWYVSLSFKLRMRVRESMSPSAYKAYRNSTTSQ
jgi:hypothetical protein